MATYRQIAQQGHRNNRNHGMQQSFPISVINSLQPGHIISTKRQSAQQARRIREQQRRQEQLPFNSEPVLDPVTQIFQREVHSGQLQVCHPITEY